MPAEAPKLFGVPGAPVSFGFRWLSGHLEYVAIRTGASWWWMISCLGSPVLRCPTTEHCETAQLATDALAAAIGELRGDLESVEKGRFVS